MRILNPVYTPPAGPLDGVKAQLDAWFAANPDKQSVSFDQLRAFFVANGKPGAAAWTDGAIHAQLLAWGFEVSE